MVDHGDQIRFGISFTPIDVYSDVRLLADMAREAEDAGWDGCFVWDHIQVGWQDTVADPWVALTAIALATKRIRVGTLVTALYRRHPWKLARETVTLDHLSHGRLILGVGLGSDLFGEISAFGGPLDDRVRAQMLDEGLAVLTGLWSGEPFSFEGEHFRVNNTRFIPVPVQSPRIPIWLAGTWPRRPPFRRAARYDGVIPVTGDIRSSLSAAELGELIAFVSQHRGSAARDSFDVVYSAGTPGESGEQDREIIAPYTAAGATWWLESMLPWQRSPQQARERIRRGPPR
jgi:alkanesulfonate monooxygenase SsuD/methylene tetrahydromethanopterin reductase-like flavin-dependent oxidoreductase (luciferase family)